MQKDIIIRGARANNLKNINLTLPRDKFIVLTGLSGSGKSSLAFDTIYAEGQRRYVESLSAYARQFLGQMDKPEVDYIEGLSPAISIDQKTTNKNPRSTVGTVTEIYDYLRLLYARVGIAHCHICGKEISSVALDQIVDELMALPEKSKLTILAPVVNQKKGRHEKVLDRILREGFVRARVDGQVYSLEDEEIKLEKNIKHTIEIVIDRVVVREGVEGRLSEACDMAIEHGNGLIIALVNDGENEYEKLFSTLLSCPDHGVGLEEKEPRTFSFNSPFGACPTCAGLGVIEEIDPELLIEDENLSIYDGVFGTAFASMSDGRFYRQIIDVLMAEYDCDVYMPYKDIPTELKNELLYGTGDRNISYEYRSMRTGIVSSRSNPFEGVIPNLQRRYIETDSEFIKEKIKKYMSDTTCPTCNGKRLKPEVLAVTVGGRNIYEICEMPITDTLEFFSNLELEEKEQKIAAEILKEINARLTFLIDVGLDYLMLSRKASTLSGGESQRIRLATQIGSKLIGVLYILDEPSIGLHQKDNDRLLASLRELTDIGNTLIVVEHDEDTMNEADYIVDIGPYAGVHGGEVVAEGTIEDIKNNPASITGQFLSGKRKIEIPETRRKGNGEFIKIVGASENNLKNIDVEIPLGTLTCVTGVSGSGKSSLINEILFKSLSNKLNRARIKPGKHKEILGIEHLNKVIDVNQEPIGRTPRSNPATYTGVFTHIRDLFEKMPEAKLRGYTKSRFSFNVKGGRCEACKGDGIIKIEMHFLPDMYVVCDVCQGKRYNRETLEVKYRGKSIYDVLNMTVEEAVEFFEHIPAVKNKIDVLNEVGLGYIKLGQPSTELSGGEAQRIKLATELSKRGSTNNIYILDEPTTGLHFADIEKINDVLNKLVDSGNTVVVIEHNLDVIKIADHIIDLGPEGGIRGGEIVAIGTPEEVAQNQKSATGYYIKKVLNK
ncbi:MAG: excinuclease ABC subunit UvrA [Eubacteriales bacterium]|nr:excinuclease ABC subunit UvrA [Eubacteriales bacterium]MDY3333188.1 excinuclease ABC subunit UvrA [Gallibacter sp.]